MSLINVIESYQIVWLTTRECEWSAACAMCSGTRDPPDDFPKIMASQMNMECVWGSIEEHYVCIAKVDCVEEDTAQLLLRMFRAARVFLMVGIGSGIPRAGADVRLGDVVVGYSGHGGESVVRYVKSRHNKRHVCEGGMDVPPNEIRRAICEVRKWDNQKSSVASIVRQLGRSYEFDPPESLNDRLFEPDYDHVHHPIDPAHDPCSECAVEREIPRVQRSSTNPEIHYGLIAACDTDRDGILNGIHDQCVCVDSRFDALIDACPSLPCLFVRGISSYAGTHRDQRWEKYAAATAAAYAKGLLSSVVGIGLSREEQAVVVVRNEESSPVKPCVRKAEQWLFPRDQKLSPLMNEVESAPSSIVTSFLQSKAYLDWKTRPGSCLSLNGPLGSGKTTLCRAILQDLTPNPDEWIRKDETVPFCLHFGLRPHEQAETALDTIIRSFALQLYSSPYFQVRHHIDSLYDGSREKEVKQPSLHQLAEALENMVAEVDGVWILVDGLDQIKTPVPWKPFAVIWWFEDLLPSSKSNVHLLATALPNMAWNDNFILLDDCLANDMRMFIQERVKSSERLCNVSDDILDHILAGANGSFARASELLAMLETCGNQSDLQRVLADVTLSIHKQCSTVLSSSPVRMHLSFVQRILQFIIFAEHPLRFKEILDAVAVQPDFSPRFDRDLYGIAPTVLQSLLPGLISFVPEIARNGEDVMRVRIRNGFVSKYLVSNEVTEGFKECLKEATAKVAVAETCLTYLLELPHDHPLEDIEEDFPLARYSAQQGLAHAVAMQDNSPTVQELLQELFSSKHAYRYLFLLRSGSPSSSDSVEIPPPIEYAKSLGLTDTVKRLSVTDTGKRLSAQKASNNVARHTRSPRFRKDPYERRG